MAMEKLRMFIQNCSALKAINYQSESDISGGFFMNGCRIYLYHQGEDGKNNQKKKKELDWTELQMVGPPDAVVCSCIFPFLIII